MSYGQKLYWYGILKRTIYVIIALLLLGFLCLHAHTSFNDSQEVKQVYQATEVKYNHHKDSIQNTVFKATNNSTNPKLRMIGRTNETNSQLVHPAYAFLKGYYNWSGQASYDNRASKLHNVATNNVLNDKKIFNRPANYHNFNNLNSVLSNLNVTIMSQHGMMANVLVDAYYTSWTNSDDQDANNDYSQNGGDSNDRNRNNGSQWFDMVINLRTHKITNVKPIYLNPRSHQSASNSQNTASRSGAGVEY